MTALSSSQPSLPSLPSRLSTIHQRLLESGLYLGDRSVREKVAWAQDGKSHKLVIKSSIPSAEALAMDNDSDSDGSPNSALVPEPATLSAVVLLSDQDFWMVADAGYRGPGKFNREFADVKPSCSGGIPDVDPFKSDFAEVTANVHWLMDSIATRGFKQKKGFVTGPADAPRLKVRHILFEQNGEVFLTNGNDKEAQVDDAALKDLFPIESWPVFQQAAKDGLKKIVATHRVVPIPAYDMHGHLIKPIQYRNRLEGAIVELHFELRHWSIGGKDSEPNSDTYVADVTQIRVLVPPKPRVVTPTKHKVFGRIDPLESPTKKSRH